MLHHMSPLAAGLIVAATCCIPLVLSRLQARQERPKTPKR